MGKSCLVGHWCSRDNSVGCIYVYGGLDGFSWSFSNIGVANAAEAKAVINAILNQNTEKFNA